MFEIARLVCEPHCRLKSDGVWRFAEWRAFSGINPFYYADAGDRRSDPLIGRTDTAAATTAPDVADASLQTTQYSYGAEPVTASYDYTPVYASPVPVPVADLTKSSDAVATNAPVAFEQATSVTVNSQPAEELADAPSRDKGGMAERDMPEPLPDI